MALKYRFGGRERRIGLGVYPAVSLASARAERDRQRAKLRDGTDPGIERKLERARAKSESDNSFCSLANEWLEYNRPRWAPSTAKKASAYLEKDLIPSLGARPIAEIRRPELVAALRKIESREAYNVAGKARHWLRQVFRFAMGKGLLELNPATDLDVVAAHAPPARSHPTLSLAEIPKFLRELDESNAHFFTKAATRLLLYTAVRPGELRAAPWAEFDLERRLWTIPGERMKMRRPHRVPLPNQAVAILRDMQVMTGRYALVFAGRNDPARPMSENTLNKTFGNLGYKGKQTGHGFRHLVSTELNERGYNRDWIESQLAHGDENEIRGTYNKAVYFEQRAKMMQAWADEIDSLIIDNAR